MMFPHAAVPHGSVVGRSILPRPMERVALALCSVLMLAVFTSFRPHAFLIDDNASQWNSVADYAFEELFAGHFPTWCPYQWAGFRIDEVGYYGLYNPVMLLCYLLRLTGLSDMITLYVFALYATGILAAHALCVATGLTRAHRILLPLAYGCSTGFLLHSIWYYVYSVFGMGAVLMWTLYESFFASNCSRRLRYSAANGCCTALMFYMGNAQLAFYLACANFAVAGCFIVSSQNRRLALASGALSAVVAAAALAPVFHVYGHAAQGALFAGAPQMIPARGMHAVLGLFLHPDWVGYFVDGAWRFSLYGNAGGGALAILAAAFAVRLVAQEGSSGRVRFIFSCAAAAAGALYLASGPELLQHLPVAQKFRMAFKWLFVVPPLALAAAAVGAQGQTPRAKHLGTGVLAVFIGLSLLKTTSDDWGYTPSDVSQAHRDLRPTSVPQHRTVFASSRPAAPDAPVFGGIERLRTEHLLANAGTSRRTPTLSGYNLSLPSPYPDDLTALMGEFWNLGPGVSLERVHENPAQALAVLRSYGVKTFLVEGRDLGALPSALGFGAPLQIGPDLYAVELAGVPPLVTNSRNEAKDFVLHADGISVSDVSSDDGAITARWWPLKGFAASFEAPHQQPSSGPLLAHAFLRADVPSNFRGTLHFTLHDGWSVACLCMAQALLLSIVALLLPRWDTPLDARPQ